MLLFLVDDSLEGLLVRIEQGLDARPLGDERVVLGEQVGKQIGLVQARDEPRLDVFAREVDEQLIGRKGSEVSLEGHNGGD